MARFRRMKTLQGPDSPGAGSLTAASTGLIDPKGTSRPRALMDLEDLHLDHLALDALSPFVKRRDR